MKPLPKLKKGRVLTLLPLAALSLSLQGCETFSPKSQPIAPTLPARPPLTEPLPSESYSERAANDIRTWREKLMLTP